MNCIIVFFSEKKTVDVALIVKKCTALINADCNSFTNCLTIENVPLCVLCWNE